MSLRTKILAAVVGLNLVVLVFAVVVLLLGVGGEERRAEILRLVEKVRVDPGDGEAAREQRRHNVDLLWTALPGLVECVLWLEEDDDPLVLEPRPHTDAGSLSPTEEDLLRAVEYHRVARRDGRNLYFQDELLVLLEGGREAEPPPGTSRRASRRRAPGTRSTARPRRSTAWPPRSRSTSPSSRTA